MGGWVGPSGHIYEQCLKSLALLFSFFHAKVYVYKKSQLLALYYVFSKIFHIEYLKNT